MSNKLSTVVKNVNKKPNFINKRNLKNAAIVGGSIGGGVLAARGIKKHDEKKLIKDEKTRFRRDVLVPGTKRTLKQSAAAILPVATTVALATKLKHKHKDGNVYKDMTDAIKHIDRHKIVTPEKARKLLKNSAKVGAGAYVGSQVYLRDKAYRDRHEKYIGTKAGKKERAINAVGVPVARKANLIASKMGVPLSPELSLLGSMAKGALVKSTPEAMVQRKRRSITRKNKMKERAELAKEQKTAFDIVIESFDKIAGINNY